jgi:hypothetical protein
MASPELAARMSAAVQAAVGPEVEAEAETQAAEGTEVTETDVAEVSTEQATEEAEAAAVETPEQAEAKARAVRLELFEEKLKSQREKRQAMRLAEQAKADRRAAQAEREAAKAERAKYDGLKQGSFKDTLAALGRDPREAWEEMNREAIEASTPEAQAKRDEAARQKALDDRLNPMQQELEQLRAERAYYAQQAHQTNLVSNYQRAAADPAFADLRIEYPDEALLEHAQHYDRHPDQLRAAADQYGVRLTAPEKGFTMHELLQVLAAAQAAHIAGVQARRAAQSPAELKSTAQPTVNGTAPRRSADTAIGNDLASQRASARPAVSGSVKDRVRQRIEEEIRRGGG